MRKDRLKSEILRDPVLSKLSSLSKEKAIPLFLVGGYIRDLLLGIDRRFDDPVQKDYDLALPKEGLIHLAEMERVLQVRFFKVGKEELDTVTYRITKPDLSVDLTPFQGQTIEEDLQRRDFTLNAIAYSFKEEDLYWAEGAFEDIEKGILRAVSNRSIDQDPLRMLRAIRYLCTLPGLRMEEGLKNEILAKSFLVRSLPGERLKTELDRVLLSPMPGQGVLYLYRLGLLLVLFPELKGLEGLGQSEHHHLDVLSHTLLMIERISWAKDWISKHHKDIPINQEDWLSVYYAALFHDIGKRETYSRNEDGKVHFYFHESFSCQAAERIMERLRFSNSLHKKIVHLIENHMRIFNLSRETKEGALKRLVNKIGEDTPLLILHALADKEASRGTLSIQVDEVVEKHCLRLLELYREKEIIHPPVLISGHDVMRLGYEPGPKVGEILRFIKQRQLEGEIKDRDQALTVLEENFGHPQEKTSE